MKYDVVVIGGAFAGLTAALYTSRQGMKTAVITKDIGGQGLLTNDIQNFPGFVSISGFELASKFQEQAQLYGAEFVYDEVISIEEIDGNFISRTREQSYESEALILAFGKTPRDLGVKGEEQFKGRGVSYCSICDGPLYRGKEVVVAGAGDHALQAALYLATVTSNVHVLQKTNRISGTQDMIEQTKPLQNIHFIYESEVDEIKGDRTVNSLLLRKKDGSMVELKTNAVFVEMGYVAKTSMLKDFVEMNKDGEVIINMNNETSRAGVFAAGDVTNIPFKQAVISAGHGSVAALSAINYIHRKHGRTAPKSDWKYIDTSKKEKS